MPVSLPADLMVSVSGFRGRIGAGLTPELAAAIAAAYGDFLLSEGKDGPVVVGRDSRTSGTMIERAVLAGLQSVGVDAIDVGIVPTPTVMLAVEHHGAAGGIAVTASHNPAEWNALKLASSEGMFLDGKASKRFLKRLAELDPERAPWDELGEVSADPAAVDRHVGAILDMKQIDLARLKRRKLKVALDCVRGAGGVIMPRLLEDLGCEVVVINGKPDGWFPRDPEPTADSLKELGALVREHGCDIGLAVDPDVDRLSLVDEKGRALGEDMTLALAAAVVLRKTPGPVVTNLSTSQVVEDVARAYDVPIFRTPVGEINVARGMQQHEAVIGGEGNGGVILPDVHYTRDAPIAAALILQYLADCETTLSRSAADWPSYEIVKRKVTFDRSKLAAAYKALDRKMDAELSDTSDGLRLSWPEEGKWLHVRPSGTEPIVRLIAEGRDKNSATDLLDRAAGVMDGVS